VHLLFSSQTFAATYRKGLLAMRWLLLLLVPGLSGVSGLPDKELPQFGLRHFTKQSGLTSATILSTEQSQQGYLWIGTYDGLNRFNGVDFRAFTNKSHPQLPSNAITALMETSDGALWIGTLGHGVVAFEDSNLEHEIPGSRLSGLYVNQLLETQEGAVLAATRSGVFRFDQGKWHAEPIRSSGSTQSPCMLGRLLLVLKARCMLLGRIASSGGGKVIARTCQVHFPSGISADCIAWHPSSGLWVGTYEHGLFQWHEGQLKEYGRDEGWLSPAVADLAFDSEGSLWAGGRDGVARIRPDGLSWLNLGGQMAFCLEPDLMGGMWVGTYHHGIYQLGNSVFSSFTPRHRGEVAILGRSVVEWQDQILVGTNRGFYEIRGGYLVPSDLLKGWDSVLIRQALVSKDGGLWVATHTHGLGRVEADGSCRWFGLGEGLGSLTIRAVLEDRQGRVWIGSSVGLYVLEGGRISKVESMGAPVVLTIHELRDGTLFVGLDGEGFALISEQGIRMVSTDDGLPSGIVFSAWEDAHGVLWLTCNGGGIVRYTHDGIRWFYRPHGLPDHSLFYLIPDDQGSLWMGSQSGVYRISLQQLEQAALGDPSPIRVILV
jgi:ligand-binding sensor domain-containing protein